MAIETYANTVAQEFLTGLNVTLNLSVTLEQLRNREAHDVLMKEVNELSDPMDGAGRKNPINAVSARWNEERDKFLVKAIGSAMVRGKKPYVIFGASHAVHCNPALQKLAGLAK